jgi:hypothetical protein
MVDIADSPPGDGLETWRRLNRHINLPKIRAVHGRPPRRKWIRRAPLWKCEQQDACPVNGKVAATDKAA